VEPNSSGSLTLTTNYTYNWQGQLSGVSQQGDTTNTSLWRSRTFQYDGAGRLISQTTPEAGTSTLAYDNNGNLQLMTNQNTTDNNVQYTYDAGNRLISETLAGGPTYTYTYDAMDSSGDLYGKGLLTSTSNGTKVQTRIKHDPFGNVLSTAYCLPSDCSFNTSVSSTYDFQGNMTSLTYPDGRLIQWTYDKLNQVVGETYAQFGTNAVNTPYASNLSYTPSGQLQQATLGNGVQYGATYDVDQNLASLTYVAKGTPIVEKTYSWDRNAANLLSIQDYAAGRTQTYQYDTLDRISTLADSGSTANACNANLPSIPQSSQSYNIDAWGNLQQSGSFSFSQLIGSNNQVTATGYGYDNAGNMTSDGLGNSYQYRPDGLMSSSDGAAYTYDALGQRVRKDASTSTEYIYWGGQILAMRNPTSGAWTDRVYGPSGALATVGGTQSAGPTYRLGDHLGSVHFTTDPTGNIVTTTATLPFGQLSLDGGDQFPFTDHERDENASYATLYRHFSPAQGRWLSPDPSNGSYNLQDPQSLNRYSYVNNRPMAHVDSEGLDDDDGDDDDGGDGWSFNVNISFVSGSFGGGSASGGWSNATIDPSTGIAYATVWLQFESLASGQFGVGSTSDNFIDSSLGVDFTAVVTAGTGIASGSSGGAPVFQKQLAAPNNGIKTCKPVAFRVTGIGPGQAQATTAITQTPREQIPDGGVAIKPRNFGAKGINGRNRSVFAAISLSANWGGVASPIPGKIPAIPAGLPSMGPYSPVDNIGPASVRNSRRNAIDVYNYASQSQALASTRTVMITATIPANTAGVTCPR